MAGSVCDLGGPDPHVSMPVGRMSLEHLFCRLSLTLPFDADVTDDVDPFQWACWCLS